MFHDKSAVERGFNTNAELAVENQAAMSLMALRMAHDHMITKEMGPHNIEINKELRRSIRKSRQRYDEYLEEQSKRKRVTENDLKRKIVTDEIKDVQKKKKRFLASTIEGLHFQNTLAIILRKAKDVGLI